MRHLATSCILQRSTRERNVFHRLTADTGARDSTSEPSYRCRKVVFGSASFSHTNVLRITRAAPTSTWQNNCSTRSSGRIPHGAHVLTQIDQALREAKPVDTPGDLPHAQDVGGGGGLATARVLLVHSGGDSQRSPTQCVCGKAWSALNSCGNDSSSSPSRCNTPMDLLLDHLSRLFSGGGSTKSSLDPGTLVVTACDVMLLIPPEVAATADWSFGSHSGGGAGGVVGLAIAADAAKYAPNHGVYCLEHGAGGGRGSGQAKHGIIGVSK